MSQLNLILDDLKKFWSSSNGCGIRISLTGFRPYGLILSFLHDQYMNENHKEFHIISLRLEKVDHSLSTTRAVALGEIDDIVAFFASSTAASSIEQCLLDIFESLNSVD